MISSSVVDPDPDGSGTFWPCRIRIWNNFTVSGCDLFDKKSVRGMICSILSLKCSIRL
jgi:hypothetical protein